MNDSFRFAQIVCWVLPGFIAGWSWGLAVGFLTFGAQMLSAPPLTRMYIAYRAGKGPVDVEDVQRFNLMANLVAGSLYAFLARLVVGESLPA